MQQVLFPPKIVNLKNFRSKRRHYKKATYNKVYQSFSDTDDLQLWHKFCDLSMNIANYYAESVFNFGSQEKVITGNGFTIHIEHYKKGSYTYKGALYNGQDFTATTVDVVGAEDLRIEERVFLLEIIYDYLKNRKNMNELAILLKQNVFLLKNGFTARSLILALLFLLPQYKKGNI